MTIEKNVLENLWRFFLTKSGVISENWQSGASQLDAAEFEYRVRKIVARSREEQRIEEKTPDSKLANFLKERSFSMSRFYEKISMSLWDIYDEGGDYARLIDVYLNDDGAGLSAIVAQSGKLFQVPLSVSNEEVTLGSWVQVEEKFTPVQQNNFRVFRQKDGRHRWVAIAGTSILNRSGEIDSVKLFDSFIQQSQEEGVYPRLDYYHHGEENPELWEFGTADYLAREGVCYIASGLFDEDHPLAKATIRACERDEAGTWGNSIEFWAYAEPEKISLDPEITIPVYNDGINTRISVVLEKEAAALFTRLGVLEEGVKRAMNPKTTGELQTLFGEDSEELNKFLEKFEKSVDQTNKRVKDERLIHRTAAEAEAEATEDEAETEEETTEDEETPELVLDDAAVEAIAQVVFASPQFKQLGRAVESLIKAREADQAEIAELKEANDQLAKIVGRLAKDDGTRKTEYLQDLPSRKTLKVSYRASEAHNEPEDGYDDAADPFVFGETYEDIAERTLSKLPSY